jgi:hypothetical protein
MHHSGHIVFPNPHRRISSNAVAGVTATHGTKSSKARIECPNFRSRKQVQKADVFMKIGFEWKKMQVDLPEVVFRKC